MGKRVMLAWAPILMVVIAACSVKRTTFTEGIPGDASPDVDAPVDAVVTIADGSPAEDAPVLVDAVVPMDAAVPVDAPAPVDAPVPVDAPAPVIDAPPPALGTQENPAGSCSELQRAAMPSAVYWVRHPQRGDTPFQVYCEQGLNNGGWAMLFNSVRREDGTTAAFWTFRYAERLNERGTLALDQNYYHGALYQIGTEYMDVFVDLANQTAIAAVMTATGFDPVTMRFTQPVLVSGDRGIFDHQFAMGWSAPDFDGDFLDSNCAVFYSNVTQHYGHCWFYNLGSDADSPLVDGGVGPHVFNDKLTALRLGLQDGGGRYSQVRRIARFTRW